MVNDIQKKEQQPLDTGSIWSNAWTIFSTNIKSLLLITLTIFLPLIILNELLPYERIYSQFGTNGLKLTQNTYKFLNTFLRLLGTMAIVFIAEGQVNEINIVYKDAIKRSYSHWGKSILATLLAVIVIIGYSLLLIIPGIIKVVQYIFVNYVVVLRGRTGKEALDYSKAIVEGNWWRVVGFYLLIRLITWGAALAVFFPLRLIPNLTIIHLLVYTIFDFFGTYFVILLTILFLDLEQKMNERQIRDENLNVINAEVTP